MDYGDKALRAFLLSHTTWLLLPAMASFFTYEQRLELQKGLMEHLSMKAIGKQEQDFFAGPSERFSIAFFLSAIKGKPSVARL